jgi:peroxiredoxin family protein
LARPVVIFLRSGEWEARYQAATLAATAAALGDEVHLALFFGALRAWVEGHFDEGSPREAAGARVGSLRSTLEEARRGLGLRVVACDTAVRLAGLDPARVAQALDGIVSLPELWRLAQAGRVLAL